MNFKKVSLITAIALSTMLTAMAADTAQPNQSMINSSQRSGQVMSNTEETMVTTSGKVVAKQTAGRRVLGEFAPTFAHLNDDVLFGEVWSRDLELLAKQRSIITITALVSQGLISDALKAHFEMGKKNGITKDEIAEILTHIAFYAGWPKVWGAFPIAKEVWGE